MSVADKLQLGIEVMAKGMGGIFLVIIITIIGTLILTKISSRSKI